MRSPLMQCTTQLNHSTVSQQTVVSTSHGDLSQLVPIPHLEVGGTDIVRQLPPPTTSFPSTSSLEPIATSVNLSLARTPVQTTFAGGFSSPAGTTGVSSAFVAGLRGPEGNPISANIMPTLNMGSLGSTFGSTRSLSDLGVSLPVSPIITALRQQSTILGSSSTPVGSFSSAAAFSTPSSTVPAASTSAASSSSAPSSSAPPQTGTTSSSDVDLSRMPVVITANQLITRSLFRANNEQMATVIKQQTERISALEKQVAALAKGKAPMPDPPAQPTQSAADSLSIPELKGLLFSKLLEVGSSEDSDLVGILQQQTALQQRAIQEQRSQAHLVTHTEFQQFQASLDASLTKTFTEINKMFTDGLSQLSERIRGVEETCQTAARRPTRRHDDHDDHDRHEGERKRRRLESEPSRAPTTSGVRIVDRFEERPPREKQPTRHRDAIVLAGGEEMEIEEPVMQSTLDFLSSVQEEVPEERVEESGVKFSGASSSLSEIDRVLALLDNVASELRDYQVPNEEINDARCAEDIRLKDMFDDVEFDFEKEKPVDDVEGPSLEEVLPQDDLMPVDPKKVELWEKMKASSGKFLKRTEWDRFTRATGKYLEERYKSRFCYHERKLSYTKLYGIENLKKELRTEYIHMRRVNRQRREMLVSDHKFVSVTSYKTSKLSAYLYPVITFRRDDGKEYTITEADFQDMSFDVILGILYDLKGKTFRTEEEIIALTAIVRHVKVSISLAHLYDFQLGLENWTSKLFCHKPRRNLIGDEKDFVMYTVFYDAEETEISCVYPDSMGNKKRMYSHEVMLYCDDTLKMVMDNLNLRLQMDSHKVHDISAANKVLIRHFVSEIDRRLRLRVDIRFAEIKFKLRKPSFQNKLSLTDALFMIRPITDSDIRDAMFQIGTDKAPGSDGFTSQFFRAAWGIVGRDVTVAIHNFFYRGRLAKELNHTLICLLPKTPNASSVSDFRPISCCSVLYKCISKVVVNRMKPFLDGLVDRSQSAFIPGRRIVDNILMAHELVVGYHLNVGEPRCAFKIDLRKAYDMVDWRFLVYMLEGFGFHPVLVSWIREMVSTTTYSVIVNGESWGHFPGKRGIRQGDPLSPYLFTLVMEGFAMIFKQCIEEASQFKHHPGCSDIALTHLCFADDLFVFTGGDVASVEVLKKALFLFEKRSGLSPNLTKSDVFFGNVAESEKQAILTCLPFRMGSFPIRYLGVPLSPVFLKVSDYGGLISRVKQRIQNWKMKALSFGGRRQLVISVLQSLQLYWMAIFVFPSSVIHELEVALRSFLWAQGDAVQGKCRIAWSVVCQPRECGGLGLKDLTTWNRALIAKNLWDIIVVRPTLWVSWVRNLLNHANSGLSVNPILGLGCFGK
ncbi:hypothetical protein OSB04_un000141 [Centaurea solstitialis]|uniref:Reverse transcriptase domain-containing protein n=1 Tax=Centaurea solstitialis TaxID=347529 RepID=A0AA38S6G2_9ASTR|nr:hypothetical protein OSB04_un000141 [Centaurea solstitialis]